MYFLLNSVWCVRNLGSTSLPVQKQSIALKNLGKKGNSLYSFGWNLGVLNLNITNKQGSPPYITFPCETPEKGKSVEIKFSPQFGSIIPLLSFLCGPKQKEWIKNCQHLLVILLLTFTFVSWYQKHPQLISYRKMLPSRNAALYLSIQNIKWLH